MRRKRRLSGTRAGFNAALRHASRTCRNSSDPKACRAGAIFTWSEVKKHGDIVRGKRNTDQLCSLKHPSDPQHSSCVRGSSEFVRSYNRIVKASPGLAGRR